MSRPSKCVCGRKLSKDVRQKYPEGGGWYCSTGCRAKAKSKGVKVSWREPAKLRSPDGLLDDYIRNHF